MHNIQTTKRGTSNYLGHLGLSVLAGALAAVAFEPTNFYASILISYALLIYLVRLSRTPREAFGIGFAWGFSFYLILAWWLGVVLDLYYLPFPLSIYQALFSGVAAALSHILIRGLKPTAAAFVISLMMFLTDRARELGSFSFPWGNPGSIFSGTFFSNTIIFFGPAGISFLLWLLAASFDILFEKRRTSAMIFTLPLLFAFLSPPFLKTYDSSELKTIKVAVASESLTPEQKHTPNLLEREDFNLRRFMNLVKKANETDAKLLVFPESAFPYDLGRDTYWLNYFMDVSRRTDKVLIVGSAVTEKGRDYNRIFVFDKGKYKTYDKKHLVPFGEYLPYKEHLGFLRSFGAISDFTQGDSPGVVNTSVGKIGLGIC